MGVKIVVKDADFAYTAVSYDSPVKNGLKYLNFFGTDKRTLTRNLAPGMPQASVVGEPALYPDSAGFAYLEKLVKTGVQQTKDVTIISVFTVPAVTDASRRHIVSNYGRNSLVGNSLSLDLSAGSPTAATFTNLVSNNGGASTQVLTNALVTAGSPVCVVAKVDSVGRASHTINKTTGVSRQLSYAATYDPQLNGEYYVGSAVANLPASAGEIKVSFVAIYDRALTDDEIDAAYVALKKFYVARGVNI